MMNETLALLSATTLGLFAGSLLTEAMLLVPFFRALSFDDFNRLHPEFGPRLYRYFTPLTISATIVPIVSAASMTLTDPRSSLFSWVAVVLGLMILSTYFLYFRRANLAFAEQRLDAPALVRELTLWARVHNVRTILAIAAFVASIVAAAPLTIAQ